MTAKELVLERARDWSEDDAEAALRAVEHTPCRGAPRRAQAGRHASEQQRSEIDEAIIASYTQVPQEDLGARWAARQSIRAGARTACA